MRCVWDSGMRRQDRDEETRLQRSTSFSRYLYVHTSVAPVYRQVAGLLALCCGDVQAP